MRRRCIELHLRFFIYLASARHLSLSDRGLAQYSISYFSAKPLAKRKKNANISVLSVRLYQNFIQQTEYFRHIIADGIQGDFRTPIVASISVIQAGEHFAIGFSSFFRRGVTFLVGFFDCFKSRGSPITVGPIFLAVGIGRFLSLDTMRIFVCVPERALLFAVSILTAIQSTAPYGTASFRMQCSSTNLSVPQLRWCVSAPDIFGAGPLDQ